MGRVFFFFWWFNWEDGFLPLKIEMEIEMEIHTKWELLINNVIKMTPSEICANYFMLGSFHSNATKFKNRLKYNTFLVEVEWAHPIMAHSCLN